MAQAQPAPPSPPPPAAARGAVQPPHRRAPPAPPPPPAADFGVAPAALPSDAGRVDHARAGRELGQHAGRRQHDQRRPTEEKKQSPFYFTRFSWGNTGRPAPFGVGGHDIIGPDGDQYL